MRRAYVSLGPFQQPQDEYPTSAIGNKARRFSPIWSQAHPWLEYSPAQNAVYCFPCFLFAKNASPNKPFVTQGVSSWNKITGKDCKLLKHAGQVNSAHSRNMSAWQSLPIQQRSIQTLLHRQCQQQIADNVLRLSASIETIRFLSSQGLVLRGHDESKESSNRGNFLELLSLLCKHSDDYGRVCLDRAPQNASMTSPDIQKDIVRAMASEVRERIVR